MEDSYIVDAVEEDPSGTYYRYICPLCKKVLCTGKGGSFYDNLWDKLISHKLVCKKYLASVASGKIVPGLSYYKIISYHIS